MPPFFPLGAPVVYTVPEAHNTTTLKASGPEQGTHEGSIHHPQVRVFAGVIGRVHPDGRADVMIFVPNRLAQWVDAVEFGDGPGRFMGAAEYAYAEAAYAHAEPAKTPIAGEGQQPEA